MIWSNMFTSVFLPSNTTYIIGEYDFFEMAYSLIKLYNADCICLFQLLWWITFTYIAIFQFCQFQYNDTIYALL
jgi:hypothetical protein